MQAACANFQSTGSNFGRERAGVPRTADRNVRWRRDEKPEETTMERNATSEIIASLLPHR